MAFPNEPLVEVTAPIVEAQLFETMFINQVGFQSLIATKAARMRDTVARHGDDQSLVDFGSRRAHGTDAGVRVARAAYIGGFTGSSNVAAGHTFDIPVVGTMAHSWVQSFPTEREAFEAFVDVYGDESVLLVDAYDTIGGAKTAIEAAERLDIDITGVRLDSGDLTELSKAVARVVGKARIFISSAVNDYEIETFLTNGGTATGFGPGTALVTSADAPTLDAVYKLVAVERNGVFPPSTKLSSGKPTYPCRKSVRRVERDERFERDVLTLSEEEEPGAGQLVDVYRDGELVSSRPVSAASREHARNQVELLLLVTRSLGDPDPYPVQISDRLESVTKAGRDELVSRCHGES